MRKFLLFLLLANAAVFAYGYYLQTSSNASPDNERLKPINPDAIKILSSQQVSKLGPAKMAQLTLACAEWGPFSESERIRATKLLEPLNLGRTLTTRRVEGTASHWVYIPPKKDKPSADKAMAELKKLKVDDASLIIEKGEWNWAISLGVFRTKEAADVRREELRSKGVKTMAYRQREQAVALTSIVLREPPQSAIAKLEEFKTQLPGSTIATGTCPENR
jgi:hypothetical protein